MEQSSSYDEKTVRHQFDRKCKLALKGEVVDYERHLAYLRKHEVLFSELSEREIENFSIINEYELEKSYFRAGGYDVVVKDALLAEALKALTERKRDTFVQQGICNAASEKGFTGSHISPEKQSQRVRFHFFPMGHILMGFLHFRIVAFIIGKVVIMQGFVLQSVCPQA